MTIGGRGKEKQPNVVTDIEITRVRIHQEIGTGKVAGVFLLPAPSIKPEGQVETDQGTLDTKPPIEITLVTSTDLKREETNRKAADRELRHLIDGPRQHAEEARDEAIRAQTGAEIARADAESFADTSTSGADASDYFANQAESFAGRSEAGAKRVDEAEKRINKIVATPGPQGTQGPEGPRGPAGTNGINGVGVQGSQGIEGPRGPAGTNGLRGIEGKRGSWIPGVVVAAILGATAIVISLTANHETPVIEKSSVPNTQGVVIPKGSDLTINSRESRFP